MKSYISSLIYSALMCGIGLLLIACDKDDDYQKLPDEAEQEYQLIRPDNFPEIQYTVANNPISKAGFELGKRLFFDPNLSADGSISCNNCHQQSRAFADTPLHPFSIGFDDQSGTRNAPGLFNLAFRKEFFHDGGVVHLDFVAINALESPVEMNTTMDTVVARLNRNMSYKEAFRNVFGIEKITSPHVLQAFSQFLTLLISDNSTYDQYNRGEASENFGAVEKEGLALFEQHCTTCHSGILFTDQSYRNNGLSKTFTDLGRGLITETTSDDGKFLVPSLRNVAITPPYMHNATFETLEEVVQHYATGVQDSKTLDPALRQKDGSFGIALDATAQKALVAFLRTLTDSEFVSDPKFQNLQ